jgi:hypothetical protein
MHCGFFIDDTPAHLLDHSDKVQPPNSLPGIRYVHRLANLDFCGIRPASFLESFKNSKQE